MEPPISPLLYSILLFLGMLIMLETGRRLGIRRDSDQSERGNLGTIEGAVFAVFGLLMAFTFSGAASRFNEKRMLVAEEANAIGTACLRLDLVLEAKAHLQELFRRYVDSRLETYRKLPDMKAAEVEIRIPRQSKQQIWSQAVTATRLPTSPPAAGLVLLPR